MDIKHTRYNFGEKSTLSRWFVDEVFACLALEDKVREIPGVPVEQWKIPGETAIPAGRYRITLEHSPKFSPKIGGRKVPHLNDVPGYSHVLVHWGNTDKDTDGCLLLGAHEVNEDFISESKTTFLHVLDLMEHAEEQGEEIWITVA